MRQQINLYQPALREQRQALTATTAAASLGLIVLVLLLLWGYGARQVMSLQHQLDALRLQQQHQTEALGVTDSLRGSRGNPQALQAQLKTLTRDLTERQHALQLLRAGAAGETNGFALRLAALARRPLQGVWLDHLVLASGAGVLSLGGGTIDAALVPRYLQGLAAEPALEGTRFDEFRIEGPKYVGVTNGVATDVNMDVNVEPSSIKRKVPAGIRFQAVNTGSQNYSQPKKLSPDNSIPVNATLGNSPADNLQGSRS